MGLVIEWKGGVWTVAKTVISLKEMFFGVGDVATSLL